jgi:RecB family exonuclease
VAAGNPVAVHLVLGLSQNATRVRSATPVAVRRNELWAMEWSHRDRSRAFISAYTALWPNTTCSVSATGPRGARVPAAEIATQRAERPASLWDIERVWWRDRDAPLPAALYAPQERGLNRACATTLVPVTANAQREPIPLALLRAHVRRAGTLSPSAIDRYLACPFSFLVRDLLHVREGQWGYDPDPRREIGTALHDVMADLMQRPIGERLEAIEAVSESHLGSTVVRLRVPESVRRGWLSYAPRVIRALLANPAFEAERPSSTESDVSARIGSVTLAGIADRIAGLGTADPVSIYDYKLTLGDHHRASRVLGAGDPGMAASLQLPLYATMVASQYGVEVDRLAWVDLTNATVRVAADGDASRLTSNERTRLTRQFDQLQQLIAAVPEWLEEMDRRITAGELYCRDERPCDRCRIRSICRSCFVTRRYGDHR